MKQFLIPILSVLSVGLLTEVPVHSADSAAPLTRLQGKWSAKRTSDDGKELHQTIDIKGNKLTYQLANAANEVRLFARGTIETEMLGPFHVLKVSGIRAGRSAEDTEPVEDDRRSIYVLGEETLTLASNFDKERDDQKPRVDVYKLVEAPKEDATAVGGAGRLAGKWKLKVKMGDNDRDYDLSISQTDGALAATLTSPRSGDHKFKSVTFSQGKLAMELVRDIQGNEATFVYTGELKGEELFGTVVVKGYEDQFKGTWTGQR